MDKKKSIPYPWLTAILRSLSALILLLLLLGPFFKGQLKKLLPPQIVLLQDNSQSIAFNLGKDSIDFRKNYNEFIEAFKSYHVQQYSFAENLKSDTFFNYKGESTNLVSSLSQAIDKVNPLVPTAYVVFTDGKNNSGADPKVVDLPLKGNLYTVAIGDTAVQKDIKLEKVYVNDVVAANSEFEVSVDFIANHLNQKQGYISVFENNQKVAEQEYNIIADQYDQSFSFILPAGKPGFKKYSIIAGQQDGEVDLKNNRKDFYVKVSEQQKNILLYASVPHPDVHAIRSALQGVDQIKLTTITGVGLPNLNDFDALILHQVPFDVPFLQSIRIPVWYITSNGQEANVVATATKAFQITSGGGGYLLPAMNSLFSLFSLQSSATGVLDKLPPLNGAVSAVKAIGQATFPLVNKSNQSPIWLLKDTQPVCAVTLGDGFWRWGLYEYKLTNSKILTHELIKQTCLFLATHSEAQSIKVVSPKNNWFEKDKVSFQAYFRNQQGELRNSSTMNMIVVDSSGKKYPFVFDKVGNSYTLNTGSWQEGIYEFTASMNDQGKNYEFKGSFYVNGQSIEVSDIGADYNGLSLLSSKYNGHVFLVNQMSDLKDSILKNEKLVPVVHENDRFLGLIDYKFWFFVLVALLFAEWIVRKYWMGN